MRRISGPSVLPGRDIRCEGSPRHTRPAAVPLRGRIWKWSGGFWSGLLAVLRQGTIRCELVDHKGQGYLQGSPGRTRWNENRRMLGCVAGKRTFV